MPTAGTSEGVPVSGRLPGDGWPTWTTSTHAMQMPDSHERLEAPHDDDYDNYKPEVEVEPDAKELKRPAAATAHRLADGGGGRGRGRGRGRSGGKGHSAEGLGNASDQPEKGKGAKSKGGKGKGGKGKGKGRGKSVRDEERESSRAAARAATVKPVSQSMKRPAAKMLRPASAAGAEIVGPEFSVPAGAGGAVPDKKPDDELDEPEGDMFPRDQAKYGCCRCLMRPTGCSTCRDLVTSIHCLPAL